MSTSTKKLGFLLDDGWRYEKQELLHFLKGKIDFDVLTHDPGTYDLLKEDFNVVKLEVHSMKSSWLYRLVMFFAGDLKTNTVRMFNQYRFHRKSRLHQVGQAFRDTLGRLGLRPYSYCRGLRFLYRRSSHYREVLQSYDRLLFSPVGVIDKRVLFEALRQDVRLISWVFSWDNPMKDNEFLRDADAYLVWNEQNKQDLIRVHAIDAEKIHLVGPTQFDTYVELSGKPSEPPEQRYVMFAFTMGISPFVEQEIELARHIREVLDELDPAIKLMVRPYPFTENADAYQNLKEARGIGLFDYGERQGTMRIMGGKDLVEKYAQMNRAACFINYASTIVLEASFTGTPLIQMKYCLPFDGPSWNDLAEILKNDHLRYTLDHPCPNVVADRDALKKALENILNGDTDPYREYTERLQAFAHPLKVQSYKEVFVDRLGAL